MDDFATNHVLQVFVKSPNLVMIRKKSKNNNRKRALWFNKYRTLELEQRKKFPEKTDEEIWLIMYNLTEDQIFLNVETREIFIF